MQKATVPAMTQLIEQIARVVFVYTVAIIFSGNNVKMMCLIAVAGIGVGEGISMIYSMIMIIRYFVKNKPNEKTYTPKITSSLVKISTPLTENRLVVALLHIVETILIYIMLQ